MRRAPDSQTDASGYYSGMKVLLVHAHPEPRSFGAALRDRGVAALQAAGHEVRVSDLYAMNFEAVASAADFTQRRFPQALQYDREQKHAHQHQAFAADIQAEIDKLLWSDLLILQFPLWWFSVPAIMKGWLDRVFANGVAYGPGRRLETGGLRGRSAMLALTTGCFEDMTAPDGLLGDLNVILWHLHFGTFAYAGLRVLPPFTAWAIQYSTPQQRAACLDAYAQRMGELESLQPLFFHRGSDFGTDCPDPPRRDEGVQP
jgi:NAD(P)H dehydrogenase (quinone)